MTAGRKGILWQNKKRIREDGRMKMRGEGNERRRK
jgi:hypothetical protein